MTGLLFAVTGAVVTRALENTAMGILIVFFMLLVISYVIDLLKLVNKFGASEKKTETVAPAPAPVEPDTTDDTELVAVITAAIYEYEKALGNDVQPGGLVVRSIRKINKSKWQKA